ncbi:MAG TPA: FAD:protein FMN transferase [Acidimicrobiales bacterium]|nr:FAD:protein FMN transferase [Acidimicrobiales bacterium]
MAAERRFRAMGTDAHVVVHGDPLLAELAQAEIARLEQIWSRFLPDSEVSEVNRRAGSWVRVSAETVELIDRAVLAHVITGGRYDPTVLGDVVRAGYDRSFDQLTGLDRADDPFSTLRLGAGDIEIDHASEAVRAPEGVGFDPGGIGKGLAADLVAARLDAEGVAGALVNLGGDLRAIGCGPDGDDWTVDLDPATTGRPHARVVLDHGAVATSTILRRRWTVGGTERHHLIDPRSGAPAASDVVAASVIAARGWQAEVLAKAAIVAGLDDGTRLVASIGADALLVDRHGGLHPTPGFDRFVASSREIPS